MYPSVVPQPAFLTCVTDCGGAHVIVTLRVEATSPLHSQKPSQFNLAYKSREIPLSLFQLSPPRIIGGAGLVKDGADIPSLT